MASFDGLVADSAPVFDASRMTSGEAAAIATMRAELPPPDNLLAECSHDFFFLRFLRGYLHDVGQATGAYREMIAYRAENDLNAVHRELLAAGMPWPWDMPQFAKLRKTVGEKGFLRVHTQCRSGNLLTHTLVEPTLAGMRAACKAGLADDYARLFMFVDEWMLHRLHAMCVERGHLVGEHQVVDVSGVGMFSFNGVFELLKRFGKCSKHYPERLVLINDIMNSRLSLFLWPMIAPFIPKHTAAKLRVSGKNCGPMLRGMIEPSELPPSLGGTCTAERWRYLE